MPEASRPFAVGCHPSPEHLISKKWGELLREEFAAAESADMTESERLELRALAATCADLVEKVDTPEDLARLLTSDDPIAASFCEEALWSLWFQQEGPEAAARLHGAMNALEKDRLHEAIELLDELILHHPRFAEAYHQRGMTRNLLEDHLRAMEDFRRVLSLNPVHFAAMANLGHTYIQLAGFDGARKWYLQALGVHPRMPGIRQMLRELRELTHH